MKITFKSHEIFYSTNRLCRCCRLDENGPAYHQHRSFISMPKTFSGCERVRCAIAPRLLVCSGALPAQGNGGSCRPADAPSQSLTRGAGLHTSARGGRQWGEVHTREERFITWSLLDANPDIRLTGLGDLMQETTGNYISVYTDNLSRSKWQWVF